MEQWKSIIGYEGIYEVSDQGQVKSLAKKWVSGHKTIRIKEDTILKFGKSFDGYLRVNLSNNRKKLTIGVSRLVAIAFIPNPENKPEVNHKDGNKLNNHISNLEWVTHLENMRHCWNTGLQKGSIGNKNPRTKITDEQVLEIMKEYENGKTKTELSKKYNVTKQCIGYVISVRTKLHIK
jgi:hypothetical protein